MTPPVPSHGRGGLGQAAMNPVKQVLQHFGEEIAIADPAPPPEPPVTGPARS